MSEKKCAVCKGTGKVQRYFDAGDHFGGSAAPGSEWYSVPCPYCGASQGIEPHREHCGPGNAKRKGGGR